MWVVLAFGALAAAARLRSKQAPPPLPTTNRPAKVYLVGAGPGAMDLITLRGYRLLQQADVVLSDRLVDPDQLVQACKPACVIVNVGKDSSKERYSQQDLERELVQHAQRAGEGAIVVRFKGGDPFVFGLGGSEIEALEQHGIPWEYVPGLSSAMTLPGLALSAPLTHKGCSNGFVVLSGHKVDSSSPEWDQLPNLLASQGEPSTTLVVLMCAKNLGKISHFLQHDKQWSASLPCAVVQNGTTRGERVVRATLSTIERETQAQDCTQAPLTLVVGRAVDLFVKKDNKNNNKSAADSVWGAFREPVAAKQQEEEQEWWVFGYGSLVWRPDLPFEQEFDGRISGFVRRFYQTSPDHRGTDEAPGRVVTLVETHAADRVFGKVYRVHRSALQETKAKLRHREKAGYEERQVSVTLRDGRQILASVFWAPQANEHYDDSVTDEAIAQQIVRSAGPSGTNLEYFMRLHQAMHELRERWEEEGIVDQHLQDLFAHISSSQL